MTMCEKITVKAADSYEKENMSMIMRISMPNRFRLKKVMGFRTMIRPERGEIHYIGGADILPAPLSLKEETEALNKFGTEEEKEAKAELIEHNLRLVVYIAKKFDNTSVGVEDLISIESAIADTQYSIDSYETRQRTIDRQVDMSEVDIYLREDSPVEVTSEMSLGERISRAFQNSVEDFGQFLRNMLVFIVMALPALGLMAIVTAAVLLICRAKKKGKKAKEMKEQK